MHHLRLCGICLLTLMFLGRSTTLADEYKLESANAPPSDISKALQEAVSAKGYRVVGADGPVCEIWLARSIPAIEGFKPSLNVTYPLTSGQFIGVLRVAKDAEFADFRDQELESGKAYVLRYAQQPADGNHIGTSETFDFLLATPAGDDKQTAPIEDTDELVSLSTEASGTTHPAIFSLLPTDNAKPAEATLTHDEDRDFWILQAAGGEKNLVLRLVVVGVSEA